MNERDTVAPQGADLRRLPLLAAAGGILFTLLIAATPGIRFAYENITLHAASETAQALVAALLAYLWLGRLRRTRQAADLMLAWAFTVFAVTNLIAAVGLVSGGDERAVGFGTWLAVALRLFGAAGFCLGAVLAERAVRPGRTLRRRVVSGSAAIAMASVVFAFVATRWLADVIDPALSPESSRRPVLAGHGVVVTLQVVAVVLTAVAALAFARKAIQRHDELLHWLAGGATLATFSRVNFVLFPSLYSNWVYTGDILRLASYALYLIGGIREITAYFATRAEAEVWRERRRLARDLHDGLTQELSFLRSHLASLAEGRGRPEMFPHLVDAAERALNESRRAADALAESVLPKSLRVALDRLLFELTSLFDEEVEATAELDPALDSVLSGRTAEALEWIAREALSNALRHGRPRTVRVSVELVSGRQDFARLAVEDDGGGFRQHQDAGSPRVGLGLSTMRERAEELGGAIRVSSVVGEGTVVEVEVPVDS